VQSEVRFTTRSRLADSRLTRVQERWLEELPGSEPTRVLTNGRSSTCAAPPSLLAVLGRPSSSGNQRKVRAWIRSGELRSLSSTYSSPCLAWTVLIETPVADTISVRSLFRSSSGDGWLERATAPAYVTGG
jgi:hypothetical protein